MEDNNLESANRLCHLITCSNNSAGRERHLTFQLKPLCVEATTVVQNPKQEISRAVISMVRLALSTSS